MDQSILKTSSHFEPLANVIFDSESLLSTPVHTTLFFTPPIVSVMWRVIVILSIVSESFFQTPKTYSANFNTWDFLAWPVIGNAFISILKTQYNTASSTCVGIFLSYALKTFVTLLENVKMCSLFQQRIFPCLISNSWPAARFPCFSTYQ